MPVDPAAALAAPPRVADFEWSAFDVLLYHLALGAGADPSDPRELRYATEPDLQVLPTFGVVAPGLRETAVPQVASPGISIELSRILHGSQRIDVHRPLPTGAKARASARIVSVYDKGAAAVVETETTVSDLAGTPLWTSTSSIFARGEGRFGGERGPSGPPPPPQRAPEAVLVTPTLPQQALWYRLLGDRNPLHSDPALAARAGFPKPILHGLCTYGLVCKAIVDGLLDGAVPRVAAYSARFAGIVFPGETLRTAVWEEDGRFVFATSVDERDGAPALSGAELVTT